MVMKNITSTNSLMEFAFARIRDSENQDILEERINIYHHHHHPHHRRHHHNHHHHNRLSIITKQHYQQQNVTTLPSAVVLLYVNNVLNFEDRTSLTSTNNLNPLNDQCGSTLDISLSDNESDAFKYIYGKFSTKLFHHLIGQILNFEVPWHIDSDPGNSNSSSSSSSSSCNSISLVLAILVDLIIFVQ
ncbi:hypothetical protein Glove_109g319 [Diversispora epigaea]|uniref:Uncharacterized protein n=1 Tax=Diversispora epigaea TaxID=1348612 RepID=A0A397J8W0_9GLOM|nr:hypothetical protein Glove_109g319 [Diversispora epigaea]